MKYQHLGRIDVAEELYDFIEKELRVGSAISYESFWHGVESLIAELTPKNEQLLKKRVKLQTQLNNWYQKEGFSQTTYEPYLRSIGYLEEEVADFKISTRNVDTEITHQAGPQLVVPLDNARYALNAANARWGSLYDALYGTNVISEEEGCEKGTSYNPKRGEKVIAFAKNFLDEIIPLEVGSHFDVSEYHVGERGLEIILADGQKTSLKSPEKWLGFNRVNNKIESLLFINHHLHVEVQIDREHFIGQGDKAGVKDVLLEAALTTIMDCEDSVAAVDTKDKLRLYQNWLGLMKGDLQESFIKDGKTITRKLAPDRSFQKLNGERLTLSGRSLLFIRHVGHLMTTNMILLDGKEVPEGIVDTIVTSFIAKYSLVGRSNRINSQQGSVYIVKPKMHGSEEVGFANTLFNRVEDLIGLERNTLKIGVMDEERRTSVNLKNCIYQVRKRIVFINTGFLDRTGDEIFTSMELGPVVRKSAMKQQVWLEAYEQSNVLCGLSTGFYHSAQIGKGMWAMPDQMKEMLDQKKNHPQAGANTAWVPSPTAAILHALHYHQIDVFTIQKEKQHNKYDLISHILTPPLATKESWSPAEIQEELNNNIQGILGYVVRWVDHGVGCSKVLDIHHIGLMEDRATLRISSQHIANWLHHRICTEEQVNETFISMAKVVDKQNEQASNYRSLLRGENGSNAFQAALALVFEGKNQPSGYTEPILHRFRLKEKEEALLNRSF
ncbi:malate synthase G [Alkalihalobacillus pseudalcaliphilus]|uniref:malate synthase G n=1 Tax=Alkalihalobacillus pseudalcaliphilus TaxID=79884 RepID=UPI00064DFD05|nr:malate synthase G [Alkalihalobacillus pseudalcaliphilus]KMK76139.1 malate synthase [Alkalihalobacillus pseudalcaliphilus]